MTEQWWLPLTSDPGRAGSLPRGEESQSFEYIFFFKLFFWPCQGGWLWCGKNSWQSSQKWFVLKLLLDIDANGQKRKHTFSLAPSFREGILNLWLHWVWLDLLTSFHCLGFHPPTTSKSFIISHYFLIIYFCIFFVFWPFPHRSSYFFLHDIVSQLLTISATLWTL